ncbi:hypothetical protein AVEN_107750-1 [Araneus ventricosus]|uniref:Uncharacterized protein n=1 Tax=Araneus ventricosus TaxID=182803 RepID=A0A4Y2JMN5_ARAVE|nr:hypothetical protein AVEN_107750-1 [Araneus ventricosus]
MDSSAPFLLFSSLRVLGDMNDRPFISHLSPKGPLKIFVHENRMKSFLSLQKFQEDDTQIWAINCHQRKKPLFSPKIRSGARNHLCSASVEWGGLRRDRTHRVNDYSPNCLLPLSEQQPAEIRPISIKVAWPVMAGLGVRVLKKIMFIFLDLSNFKTSSTFASYHGTIFESGFDAYIIVLIY